MKDNIDLTENRDFRKPFILRSFFPYHKSELPWYFINNSSSMDSLIPTGDRKTRIMKRNYMIMHEEECHRCGSDLKKKPWIDMIGLCISCEVAYDEYLRQKEDLILSKVYMKT